jgi:hypothetical protein
MNAVFCTVRELSSIEDFTALLSGLRINEALIYGVPIGCVAAKILTRTDLDDMQPEKNLELLRAH